MTPEPQQVIVLYNQLMGTRLNDLLHDVASQAVLFVKQGFTLEDLEITVLWLRREIAAQRNGYNQQSLTWRGLFGRHGAGDEWLNFHDRLAKAREAQRKGWKPRLSTAKEEPAKLTPNVIPMPEQSSFDRDKWEKEKAEREAFRRGIIGGYGS